MTSPVRPMTADEYPAFLAHVKQVYAEDMIRAGVASDVAHAKSERDHAALLTDGVETPNHFLYAIDDEGTNVGYLWLADREGELGHSLFVYGVEVDETHRGRGLGRAAMAFAEDEARRRGIGSVALNVFGGNDVARGLYRALGYREVAIAMEKAL